MREANPLRTLDDRPCQSLNRREALQLAASGVVASFTAHESPASVRPVRRAGKRVVVAGAGIGGRCCAYELMERGHEVTVLEASGRPGGHVKTVHDPLPDGLYADVGAEHFTRPGYDQYWKYVEKFGLPAVPYPRRINMLRRIGGTWYTEAQLQEPKLLSTRGRRRTSSTRLCTTGRKTRGHLVVSGCRSRSASSRNSGRTLWSRWAGSTSRARSPTISRGAWTLPRARRTG